MVDEKNLEKKVNHAVNYAIKLLQLVNMDPDVIDDLRQSAWLGALKAAKSSNHMGYIFTAAWRQAIADFDKVYRRMIEGDIPEGRTIDNEFYNELVTFFYDLRKKKGKRSQKAAERDAFIVASLIEGRSIEGIALELQCSEDTVRTYRARIRKMLREVVKDR